MKTLTGLCSLLLLTTFSAMADAQRVPPKPPPPKPGSNPPIAPTGTVRPLSLYGADFPVGVWFDCGELTGVFFSTADPKTQVTMDVAGMLNGRDVAYYGATDGTTLEIHADGAGGSRGGMQPKVKCIYSFRKPNEDYRPLNCDHVSPFNKKICEWNKAHHPTEISDEEAANLLGVDFVADEELAALLSPSQIFDIVVRGMVEGLYRLPANRPRSISLASFSND